MSEHPIQGLMTTAMENLKEMVEVNTIIGEPIEWAGGIIIPVSKVGFGFATGGTEFNNSESEEELPFGGGSGGGVSITPVAFLVIQSENIKMIHLNEQTHIYEKMIDLAPQAVEKIQEILKESKHEKDTTKRSEKSDEKKSNYEI